MFRNKRKNYNLLNDPLAERMGKRARFQRKIDERRDAFWDGARSGSHGNDNTGGLAGLMIVFGVYMVFVVIHAVITESWRTLRGHKRFGRNRKRKSKSRSKVRTVFHEV